MITLHNENWTQFFLKNSQQMRREMSRIELRLSKSGQIYTNFTGGCLTTLTNKKVTNYAIMKVV